MKRSGQSWKRLPGTDVRQPLSRIMEEVVSVCKSTEVKLPQHICGDAFGTARACGQPGLVPSLSF